MKWEQREILFRGVRQDTKECVYGFLQNQHCIYSYTSGVKNGDFYMIFPGTAVQYIGVKDIKGKKIFEGDICNLKNAFVGVTGVIRYIGSAFVLYTGNGSMLVLTNNGTDNEIRYEGNFFQNPELLEKYKLEIGE